MPFSLSTIKRAKGSAKSKKRLGRGNGSGKGTYCGRGIKGQRARSGGKRGLKYLGMKSSLQKVPKLRGFRSIKPKKATVRLGVLDSVVKDGTKISPSWLEKKGIIKSAGFGVKIVAGGEIKHKILLVGCFVSKEAAAQIEKAGGEIKF
jgi:large subunit ribosomal protein L15